MDSGAGVWRAGAATNHRPICYNVDSMRFFR
jgi:hypothetical protein